MLSAGDRDRDVPGPEQREGPGPVNGRRIYLTWRRSRRL